MAEDDGPGRRVGVMPDDPVDEEEEGDGGYTPPGQRSYEERQERRIEAIDDEEQRKEEAEESDVVDSSEVEVDTGSEDSDSSSSASSDSDIMTAEEASEKASEIHAGPGSPVIRVKTDKYGNVQNREVLRPSEQPSTSDGEAKDIPLPKRSDSDKVVEQKMEALNQGGQIQEAERIENINKGQLRYINNRLERLEGVEGDTEINVGGETTTVSERRNELRQKRREIETNIESSEKVQVAGEQTLERQVANIQDLKDSQESSEDSGSQAASNAERLDFFDDVDPEAASTLLTRQRNLRTIRRNTEPTTSVGPTATTDELVSIDEQRAQVLGENYRTEEELQEDAGLSDLEVGFLTTRDTLQNVDKASEKVVGGATESITQYSPVDVPYFDAADFTSGLVTEPLDIVASGTAAGVAAAKTAEPLTPDEDFIQTNSADSGKPFVTVNPEEAAVTGEDVDESVERAKAVGTATVQGATQFAGNVQENPEEAISGEILPELVGFGTAAYSSQGSTVQGLKDAASSVKDTTDNVIDKYIDTNVIGSAAGAAVPESRPSVQTRETVSIDERLQYLDSDPTSLGGTSTVSSSDPISISIDTGAAVAVPGSISEGRPQSEVVSEGSPESSVIDESITGSSSTSESLVSSSSIVSSSALASTEVATSSSSTSSSSTSSSAFSVDAEGDEESDEENGFFNWGSKGFEYSPSLDAELLGIEADEAPENPGNPLRSRPVVDEDLDNV